MRIARIYYGGKLALDLNITLPQETSHYLLHVLRFKVGTMLILFNGEGGEYLAEVSDVAKKLITVGVKEFKPTNTESSCKIHLAQAIGKGDKMDWVIQKVVELGVSEISPLITDFCNVKLDEQRASKRWAHWQNIIISACEQSGRTQLPVLHQVTQFNQWLAQTQDEVKIFCHPSSDDTLKSLHEVKSVTVLIGPEGGLSDNEVTAVLANSFVGISLGLRILRTETAAVTVLAVLQHKFGDL